LGRACGAHGRGEERVQGFGGKDQSGDRGVDRRMGLEWILGILAGEWIELAYESDRWQDLVNAVMKFPVLAPRK
jgi:hypothetical protein